MAEIILLAVTKMLAGFCLAGIRPESGAWVRPVRDFGVLQLGDISYADRAVLQPFDRADLALTKPRPQPPHTEDWLWDCLRVRPKRTGRLPEGERLVFLRAHRDPSPAAILGAHPSRSLGLTEPANLEALFDLDPYSGKYEARLDLPDVSPGRTLPVTDLKWRALGRGLVGPQKPALRLFPADLRRQWGMEQIFVVLGLSRTHEGKIWPLVVGVHTIPDYAAAIDYRNP